VSRWQGPIQPALRGSAVGWHRHGSSAEGDHSVADSRSHPAVREPSRSTFATGGQRSRRYRLAHPFPYTELLEEGLEPWTVLEVGSWQSSRAPPIRIRSCTSRRHRKHQRQICGAASSWRRSSLIPRRWRTVFASRMRRPRDRVDLGAGSLCRDLPRERKRLARRPVKPTGHNGSSRTRRSCPREDIGRGPQPCEFVGRRLCGVVTPDRVGTRKSSVVEVVVTWPLMSTRVVRRWIVEGSAGMGRSPAASPRFFDTDRMISIETPSRRRSTLNGGR